MIEMDKKEQILHYYRIDGLSLREISRRVGLNRKTVTRYVREYEALMQSDPEEGVDICLASKPKYPARNAECTRLTDSVCAEIEYWLQENTKRRQAGMRKQCLKKQDIHRALIEKGFCISYTVVSFYGYGLDRQHLNALQQVERTMREDEQQQQTATSGRDDSHELPEQDQKRITAVVDRWVAQGGHLHSGITIQTAADDMHLPRYLLSSWLKSTPQGLFNPWLTHLRIEEAKRQLALHPEWNNDTIAEHCGFTSRTYFQTTFKRITGETPQEFQNRQ